MVTGYIMEFHSVPVNIVQNGQAPLSSIGLRTGSACERPGMLTLRDRLAATVLPGQRLRVGADFSAGPEVFGSLLANQVQEMIRLLPGVQRDQLHALGPAVADTLIPGKVVAPGSPGEQKALAVPLVVAFAGAGRRCRRRDGRAVCTARRRAERAEKASTSKLLRLETLRLWPSETGGSTAEKRELGRGERHEQQLADEDGGAHLGGKVCVHR